MDRERYENLEIEVINYEEEDIITSSFVCQYELPE